MKILIIHNLYKISGGEDVVVKNELKLLTDYGHNVLYIEYTNDNIKTVGQIFNTLLNLPYSKSSENSIRKIIIDFQPDVIHVHNFFMVVTPSIFYISNKLNIPVVFTLHNFRIVSPNALLFHKGKPDEISLKHSAFWCLRHKCYRNSFILTFFVARMIQYHRKRKTWHTKVTTFIALSDFAKSKFISGGIPADKLVVKPNFTNPKDYPTPSPVELPFKQYFVYIGRLSQEKGIKTLIETFIKSGRNLVVLGNGELTNYVASSAQKHPNVFYPGYVEKIKTYDYLANSSCLIVPSECYENFPTVLLDAFYFGIPVLASRIGSLETLIQNGKNGFHFEPGNQKSLQTKIELIENNNEYAVQIGLNGKLEYNLKYTNEFNYNQLISIYTESILKLKKSNE